MGEFVVVRDYQSRPVVCRVSGVSPTAVYVSSDAEYAKIINGMEALEPVGFPRVDVFRYDATVQALLERGPVEWSVLECWHD